MPIVSGKPRNKAFWNMANLRLHPLVREALSEFIATFILMIFGVGSVAQMVLSNWKFGTFFSVNFSWGVGVTLGCYWGGGVSGAHMNPAVTLGFAAVKRLPWIKVPVYWTAQMLGAIAASACCFGVYYDALNAFDGGTRQILGPNGTAGIWATYPQPFLSTWNGFGEQVFVTAILVGCIFAITDKRNIAPGKSIAPVVIGLVVFVIGATFGFNCGYAINPARDLGPRIFTAMAGWGSGVFTVSHHWSWVPVVACLLGGVAGGYLYLLFIELHHDVKEPEEFQEVVVTGAPRSYSKLGEAANRTPVLRTHKRDNNDNVAGAEARFNKDSFLSPAPEPSPTPEAQSIIEMSKTSHL